MTVKFIPVVTNTEKPFLVKSTTPDESFEEAFIKAVSFCTRLNNTFETTSYEASVEEVVVD
jgi:hypothetical protein